MDRQLDDSRADTQHFNRPSVDEVLSMLGKILSPIYGDVLLEKIEDLEAEIKRLEKENERLRQQTKEQIKAVLAETGFASTGQNRENKELSGDDSGC